MTLVRAIAAFILILGLTFGPVTANALAVSQTFAKPCPMEQMGKSHDCPCCKDHCDNALLNCSVKCGANIGAAVAAFSFKVFSLASTPSFEHRSELKEQQANGPAPPIPIV